MNLIKSIKQKSLFKIILISFLSLVTLAVLFFSVLFVLFYVYKDDISKTLLLSLNKRINGEVSFTGLSFTPLRNFPNASLIVYDLSLKEVKDTLSNSSEPPIFKIKKTYVSVNIVDLFSSRISASGITFENGSFNIVIYPDSVTNIEKAIKKKKIVKETRFNNQIYIDTLNVKTLSIEEPPSKLNLNIEKVEINNVELVLENQLTKNKIRTKIFQLESNLSYSESKIESTINLNSKIDSLFLDGLVFLSDQQFNFDSNLEIETDSIFVKISDGSLSFGVAKILFSGIFDSKNQGYVDLSFSVSDENFGLLSLFLKDDAKKNLKSGNLFLEGLIRGKTFTEFPSVEIYFGLKSVELTNPITKREIKNLNLRGNFVSGKKEDWSEAKLKIDTLYSDIQDGEFKLSALVKNLQSPEIEANIFLSADVTGLDKVFKLGSISDLKGKIEITDRVKGKYNLNEKKFISDINDAKIAFEDFGLRVPNTIRFDKMNGIITGKNDVVYFDNIRIISEDTDLLINGEATNLHYLFFDAEKDITGKFKIKSPVFDLPNFLSFDPAIKRDFNHRILNSDVDVIAKTTTSKAKKFKSFPETEFNIKKIDATVEGFLPRIKINSGTFKVSENLLGFNLKFNNFKTIFLKGNFNFTGEYNSSKFQPFYIKAKSDFKDIYLAKLFFNKTDSIPEALSGKLSGSLFTEVQFPTDTSILKFIKLKNADLVYEFSKDTISTKNLNFYFNNIYFNDKINPNPFATMSASGYLKSDDIYSQSFKFSDVDFDIGVTNGSYEIRSDVVRLFGENAKGKSVLVFSPFSKNPIYKLSFKDVRFRAERMLATFNEDSVFSGRVSLTLELNSAGSDWDDIVQNIDGTINLSGDNLLLNGLDADEIIDKFKRSQSFNMVDLGAVLLAGPVGIAVTKGTDFARIFVLNSGKSTNITKLVSNWKIKDGIFTIKDAAFATSKNRIALTGSIGFSSDNLDLTIALLNKDGCSIFSQKVYGDLNKPTLGKVEVVGTVLAPVTNLVDRLLGTDCVVFYNGSVEHPAKK